MTETALIVGVGPGLGAALARCFAGAGMAVAVAARHKDALQPVVDDIAKSGGKARAYACDVADEPSVETLFQAVAKDLAEPNVVVFNAGAFLKQSVLESTAAELERCWKIACLGGFHVGQRAARLMAARATPDKPGGTLIFTGATASLRGSAQFHLLAVPKAGLRALAQSMARELGPKGVHVAHVIVDGQIMSERRKQLAAERPPDGLLAPDAIAANYLMLHRQPRSAWTFELDLRPWVEKF